MSALTEFICRTCPVAGPGLHSCVCVLLCMRMCMRMRVCAEKQIYVVLLAEIGFLAAASPHGCYCCRHIVAF